MVYMQYKRYEKRSCKMCGQEIGNGTDKCSNCSTDNHDYVLDWIKAVDGMISTI